MDGRKCSSGSAHSGLYVLAERGDTLLVDIGLVSLVNIGLSDPILILPPSRLPRKLSPLVAVALSTLLLLSATSMLEAIFIEPAMLHESRPEGLGTEDGRKLGMYVDSTGYATLLRSLSLAPSTYHLGCICLSV